MLAMAGKACARAHTHSHTGGEEESREENEMTKWGCLTSTSSCCSLYSQAREQGQDTRYGLPLLLLLQPLLATATVSILHIFSFYIDFIWASSLIYILNPCHLVETRYNGRLTEWERIPTREKDYEPNLGSRIVKHIADVFKLRIYQFPQIFSTCGLVTAFQFVANEINCISCFF